MFSNHSDHILRETPSWQRPAPQRAKRVAEPTRSGFIITFCVALIASFAYAAWL